MLRSWRVLTANPSTVLPVYDGSEPAVHTNMQGITGRPDMGVSHPQSAGLFCWAHQSQKAADVVVARILLSRSEVWPGAELLREFGKYRTKAVRSKSTSRKRPFVSSSDSAGFDNVPRSRKLLANLHVREPPWRINFQACTVVASESKNPPVRYFSARTLCV